MGDVGFEPGISSLPRVNLLAAIHTSNTAVSVILYSVCQYCCGSRSYSRIRILIWTDPGLKKNLNPDSENILFILLTIKTDWIHYLEQEQGKDPNPHLNKLDSQDWSWGQIKN